MWRLRQVRRGALWIGMLRRGVVWQARGLLNGT